MARTRPRPRRLVAALLAAAAAMSIAGLPPLAHAETSRSSTKADRSVEARHEASAEQLRAPVSLTGAQRRQMSATPAERQASPPARSRQVGEQPPATGTGGVSVGGTKVWFVLDEVRNTYVGYRFVLRALAPHVEVWVQEDTGFPAGDCRNDGVRNVVSAADATALANEFEDTILPTESRVFSVARGRDGSKEKVLGDGSGYFTGRADSTVALIANIRDADYYTPTAPGGATYNYGYFSPDLTEYLDRNVVTLDSYDWTHRSGANPPATNASCLPRAAAPQLYEATLAHEYQHLLEYYVDPNENTWLNEGLSLYAQTLTGYTDTRLSWPTSGANNQLACFQGQLVNDSLPYCGPENSLTLWRDKGPTATLPDYGAAYSFLTYVADHAGLEAITALHRSPQHGLASLDAVLRTERRRGHPATRMLHDWATAVATDGWIDDADGCVRGLRGRQARRFSSAGLHSSIVWGAPGAYATPGAPPNGADYVLAGDGVPVTARTIESLSFRGGAAFDAAAGTPEVEVAAWNLRLVAWSRDGAVLRIADLPLNARHRIRLQRHELRSYLRGAEHVGLIVTADDPGETASGYAPYRLRINGVLQPGGGQLS